MPTSTQTPPTPQATPQNAGFQPSSTQPPPQNPGYTTNYAAAANGPSYNVNSPAPMPVTGLTSSESPINPEQPAPTGPFDNSSVNAALASTYQLTPQEQQESGINSQLEGLYSSEATKPQVEQQAYASQGVNTQLDANGNIVPIDPELTTLQIQLGQLQNAASQIPILTQQNAESTNATGAGLAPITASALRQNALQTLQVQANIAAKNGLLQHATDLVNIAVAHQFAPIEAQINALSNNLKLIQNDPNTTVEDKARADQQTQLLSQYNTNLQAQKTDVLNAQQLVNEYAPTATADQLSQLRAAAQQGANAVTSTANSMGIKTQAQTQAALEAQSTAGTIAQQPTDLALKMAQLKEANAIASAYTNPALISGVQNGSIPVNNLNSRTLPLYSALATANANSTNPVNITQLSTNEAAAKSVITGLQTQSATITQAGDALNSNIKLLAGLSDKVNGLGIPATATITNQLLAQYSNQPDIVNYLNVLNTVRSEYAKYIARGSQVDDSTNAEAAKAIPAGVDGATLTSLYKTLQTEGDNVQSSIQAAQKGEWSQITGSSAQTQAAPVISPEQIPTGYYQASDGLLYKK